MQKVQGSARIAWTHVGLGLYDPKEGPYVTRKSFKVTFDTKVVKISTRAQDWWKLPYGTTSMQPAS